jgi:hypothetical protein
MFGKRNEAPGARPGDETLTCAQIEAELKPMMEAMASFKQSEFVQASQQRAEEAVARQKEEAAKTAAKSAVSAAESMGGALKDMLGFGFGRGRGAERGGGPTASGLRARPTGCSGAANGFGENDGQRPAAGHFPSRPRAR